MRGTFFAISFYLSQTALAAPPFPAPNHPMWFGYYYADGRYGDRTSEVFPYTNLYLAWANAYPGGTDWRPQLRASLANAHARGQRILLGNNLDTHEPTWLSTWEEIIDIARPYWDSVALLELADEPGWTQAETQAKVGQIRISLSNRGMGHRPEGVVYTQDQVLNGDAMLAPRLKWVGIEAYVTAPGSPDTQVNVNQLNAFIDQAKARVPSGKSIVMIMQAYDRNFRWTNMQTLAAIQDPAYLKSFDDPRVVALTMFSYARPGGTRDHPELKARHLLMAEALGLYDPDGLPPAPPGTPALTAVDAGLLRLGWAASPGPAVAGYRIDVALDWAFSNATWHRDRDVGLARQALAGGLSPGTRYYARVRAYGTNGLFSAPSAASELVMPQPPAGASAAPMSPAGGTAEHASGRARVVIEPGGLAEPATIILEPLPVAQLPPLGGREAVGQAMRFGPAGLSFSRDARLTLAYDASTRPAIFHYDPAAGWLRIGGTVDPVARAVTAPVSHFSVYAVLQSVESQPAVEEASVLEAYAFPNPAQGGARPTIRVAASVGTERVRVRVYNLAGEALDAFDLSPLGPEPGQRRFEARWAAEGAGTGVFRFVVEAARGTQVSRKAGRLAIIR